jgi:Peptidase A4 family
MQKTVIILTLVAFTALLPLNLGAYAFVADKPMQRVFDDASLNWAGYYVKGTGIGFANATWTVPSVVNTVSGYSSAWVGIGGVNGNGLIQTGTEQDCSTSAATAGEVKFHGPVIQDKPTTGGGKGGSGGSTTCNPVYYAWWETYPTNAEQKITTMTISPGDKMNAVLTQTTPGVWTISLYDLTHFQSFSTTVTFNPDQTTAESIIERPALCTGQHCKLTNLADFQTINFQESVSGITATSPVAFDADPTHTIIYMVDSSSKLMAQPGSLSSPGAFPTTWIRNS